MIKFCVLPYKCTSSFKVICKKSFKKLFCFCLQLIKVGLLFSKKYQYTQGALLHTNVEKYTDTHRLVSNVQERALSLISLTVLVGEFCTFTSSSSDRVMMGPMVILLSFTLMDNDSQQSLLTHAQFI